MLVQAVGLIAALVYTYGMLNQRLTLIEMKAMRMETETEMNSEFRVKWPRGELGALPDDAEQNLKIAYMEQRVFKLEAELENLAR
tara:strand:+ start:407 stop:661 length:255 start_codon:yes stop_codon:yes gene_type:complete